MPALNPNLISILGLTLGCGIFSGYIIKSLRLPQVIGHLIIGLILGISGLNLLSIEHLAQYQVLLDLALGFIGFSIGGELRWARLKRFGKSIVMITLAESIGTALFVGISVFLISQNTLLALLLGAISSATAPGGTTNVLQECRARGPLTTTLFGVVGADDAISIMMYTCAITVSKTLYQSQDFAFSYAELFKSLFLEIGLSIALGLIFGLLLRLLLHQLRHLDLIQVILLASLIFLCGIALQWHLSVVLTSMVFGITLSNIYPHESKKYFSCLHAFSTPIFILFFIFVGARLDIQLVGSLGLLGLAYILCRSVGKYLGSRLGGILSKAKPTVQHYLGLGLLSQAGIAIGLAISAQHELSKLSAEAGQLGLYIVTIITASTIFFQLLGPMLLKYALIKSGEAHG